jgi:hypothetical protein
MVQLDMNTNMYFLCVCVHEGSDDFFFASVILHQNHIFNKSEQRKKKYESGKNLIYHPHVGRFEWKNQSNFWANSNSGEKIWWRNSKKSIICNLEKRILN